MRIAVFLKQWGVPRLLWFKWRVIRLLVVNNYTWPRLTRKFWLIAVQVSDGHENGRGMYTYECEKNKTRSRDRHHRTQCQTLDSSTCFKEIWGQGMGATLTDCDIHQLVSRFNVEVQEEASVVLHYIWRDEPAKASTLSGCINALTEDKELYRVLKVAHARGMYDVVRKWQSSCVFVTLTQ